MPYEWRCMTSSNRLVGRFLRAGPLHGLRCHISVLVVITLSSFREKQIKKVHILTEQIGHHNDLWCDVNARLVLHTEELHFWWRRTERGKWSLSVQSLFRSASQQCGYSKIIYNMLTQCMFVSPSGLHLCGMDTFIFIFCELMVPR